MLFENDEIVVIPYSVGKVNIHRRRRLRIRIVVLLMNGKCKNICLSAEYRGGSVALVNVSIHNHRGLNHAIELKTPNRNRHIVNYAEPFAVIGKGMMKSTADTRCPAIRQRPLAREDRASSC